MAQFPAFGILGVMGSPRTLKNLNRCDRGVTGNPVNPRVLGVLGVFEVPRFRGVPRIPPYSLDPYAFCCSCSLGFLFHLDKCITYVVHILIHSAFKLRAVTVDFFGSFIFKTTLNATPPPLGFSRSWRSFFFLAFFFFESDFFKKPKKCQEKKLVCQEVFLAFFLKLRK